MFTKPTMWRTLCLLLATYVIKANPILPSCPSGTFLQPGEKGAQDECLPCSADQYNHLKNHRQTQCFPCAQFDEQSPYQEALISPCAPHKNAVIQCALGYKFRPADPEFPCQLTQTSLLPKQPDYGQVKEQTSIGTRDAITNLDLHYNKTDFQPQNKSTTAKDDRVESDESKTKTDKGPDKVRDHDGFPLAGVIVSVVFGTLIFVFFVLALVNRHLRKNPTPGEEGKQKPLLLESRV